MKILFVKVTNKIIRITCDTVEFENYRQGCRAETMLMREDVSGQKIWSLETDGLYVRREFAEAYGLEGIVMKKI